MFNFVPQLIYMSVKADGAPGASAPAAEPPAPADNATPPPAGGEGPKVYKPEGIPDQWLGATDQETIDKALKAYKGARDELARKKGVPEKFEDYKIELPKELEEKFLVKNEEGVDPVFEALRKAAWEKGASPDVALAMATALYEAAHVKPEDGDGEGSQNLDFEYGSFGGAEKAKPVIDAVSAWAKGQLTQGVLDEQDVEEILISISHDRGLKVFDKLRVRTGEKPIPVNLGGGKETSQKTEKELREMMQDPRYWRDKDKAYIEEVTAGFQKLYGTAA